MKVPFDAGESVNTKFRRGLDVFPGNHGDVLVKGSKIYQGLDECHAFFQRANVDEVSKDVCLEIVSVHKA